MIQNAKKKIQEKLSKSNISSWDKAVALYALELLDSLEETLAYDPDCLANPKLTQKALLNGSNSWKEYSYGGCSLIPTIAIIKRLIPENKRQTDKDINYWFNKPGPNSFETWLDCQARALSQAETLILQSLEYK